MHGRLMRSLLVAAALFVAAETAQAGVGYVYTAPSVYLGPPTAVYYVNPAPVMVVSPVAPAVPVYQPAYYLPAPPPAIVYTPVYSAPTYTYVPAAPVTTRYRHYHTWFGRYEKDRYEVRTPYGTHKYTFKYDHWDGDVSYDYDFDD